VLHGGVMTLQGQGIWAMCLCGEDVDVVLGL
jgi:hypothetical protein